MILAPAGSPAEVDALEREFASAEETFLSASWEDLKGRLSADMTAAGFWTRPDRHATLARLALMDRVRAAAATAEALRGRLAKGTQRTGKQ